MSKPLVYCASCHMSKERLTKTILKIQMFRERERKNHPHIITLLNIPFSKMVEKIQHRNNIHKQRMRIKKWTMMEWACLFVKNITKYTVKTCINIYTFIYHVFNKNKRNVTCCIITILMIHYIKEKCGKKKFAH